MCRRALRWSSLGLLDIFNQQHALDGRRIIDDEGKLAQRATAIAEDKVVLEVIRARREPPVVLLAVRVRMNAKIVVEIGKQSDSALARQAVQIPKVIDDSFWMEPKRICHASTPASGLASEPLPL